jgi:hypothetical protein
MCNEVNKTVLEAEVLVSLMGVIYEVHHSRWPQIA